MILILTACGGGGGSDDATPAPPPELDAQASTNITPEPIPPGFDFPGVREEIQEMANSNDVGAIRTHAWHIWAGMTTDSTQRWNDGYLPIWETWCGTEETFSKTCAEQTRPSRNFAAASQVAHLAEHQPELAAALSGAVTQLISFNKFNPSMAEFVAQPQPGPGDTDYDYSGGTPGKTVVDLNNAWPAGTPEADRKINETPYTPPSEGSQGVAAMELKPVLYVVKQNHLTAVPFWQGPSDSTNPATPTPDTWKTCVLFDPAQTDAPANFELQDATEDQISSAVATNAMACQRYYYAPISAIYNFQMDAAEAAAFNVAQQTSPQGVIAKAGDFAVLTAMHVSTKEIVDWTWQTFWWQAGQNPPAGDHVVGGIENMTDDVKDEWRNYAMCAAYLQTAGAGSSEMNVCYNPYLETAFGVAGGLESNCMSCHGQAITGGNPKYPANYDAPIDFNSGPYFANATSTDFSWAIANHNKAPKS